MTKNTGTNLNRVVEEPQKSTLETLSEVSESPADKSQANSALLKIIPSIDIQSPTNLDKVPIQASAPTAPVASALPQSPPQSAPQSAPESGPQSAPESTPESAPEQETSEPVEVKEFEGKRRGSKRIRTKSKVQTVL